MHQAQFDVNPDRLGPDPVSAGAQQQTSRSGVRRQTDETDGRPGFIDPASSISNFGLGR